MMPFILTAGRKAYPPHLITLILVILWLRDVVVLMEGDLFNFRFKSK